MIRPATIDDLGALARLHAECFAESWNVKSFGRLLASPGTYALIAVSNDVPQGFILARAVADESEILSIGVRPMERRQGLACAMAIAAANSALSLGADAMFLEVAAANDAALALYKRLGFREAGRRKAYYKDGGDALTLKAALPLSADMGKPAKLD